MTCPTVQGDIIRSEVLPGFQFRISDLYRQPELTELTEDPVYKTYIMTEYQAEKRRTEESEKVLLLEKQKSEKLVEKLRALGLSAEEIEKLCRD